MLTQRLAKCNTLPRQQTWPNDITHSRRHLLQLSRGTTLYTYLPALSLTSDIMSFSSQDSKAQQGFVTLNYQFDDYSTLYADSFSCDALFHQL